MARGLRCLSRSRRFQTWFLFLEFGVGSGDGMEGVCQDFHAVLVSYRTRQLDVVTAMSSSTPSYRATAVVF